MSDDHAWEWLYTAVMLCGQHTEPSNGTWDQIIKALAVVGPFLAAGIAYAAYIVADRQREIAQAKLKLDLFERRAKVYDATVRFLSLCRDYPVNTAQLPSKDLDAVVERARMRKQAVHDFFEVKIAARFILGTELADHLHELGLQYIKLEGARANKAFAASKNKDDEFAKFMQQELDVMEWLGAQEKSVADKFAPYMDLARWQ